MPENFSDGFENADGLGEERRTFGWTGEEPLQSQLDVRSGVNQEGGKR